MNSVGNVSYSRSRTLKSVGRPYFLYSYSAAVSSSSDDYSWLAFPLHCLCMLERSSIDYQCLGLL